MSGPGKFDDELEEAIARILKAAQDAGKNSGIYCPSGDVARKYADMGYQMVSSPCAPALDDADFALDLGRE